jgi:hypothetical protein
MRRTSHILGLIFILPFIFPSALANGLGFKDLDSSAFEYFAGVCRRDDAISTHLSNLRYWQQQYGKLVDLVNTKQIDASTADSVMKEMFEREADAVYENRRKRRQGLSRDDEVKVQFAELSFDLLNVASMQVFNQYRQGGDDSRIRRRIQENCLDIISKTRR